MRKIGPKLVGTIAGLLIVSSLLFSVLGYRSGASGIMHQVEETLNEKALDTASFVEERLVRSGLELEAIAAREEVRQLEEATWRPFLQQQLTKYPDYLTLAIVTEDGIAHYLDETTSDLGDRPYIKEAFEGKTAISDVIISRVTNGPVVMQATPIEGTTALLLARLDSTYLTSVVDEIAIGESGFAFLTNEQGVLIAHPEPSFVLDQVDAEELKALQRPEESALVEQMVQRASGTVQLQSKEGRQLASYSKLSNGWSVAIVAYEQEMLGAMETLKRQFIWITISIIAVGSLIAYFFARSLVRPIHEVVAIGKRLEDGDLTQVVPATHLQRADEVGTLARAFDTMIHSLRSIVGNVNHETTQVDEASDRLADEVQHVYTLTEQVGESMETIDDSASTQAAISEESASQVDQLSNRVHDVAHAASHAAENAETIHQQVGEGKIALEASFDEMGRIEEGTSTIRTYMETLRQEADQIGEISTMITSIADQTSLLALNASIEAARAGEAGAGFAVVAQEVHELADQSATSAAQIHELIASVQRHVEIAVDASSDGQHRVQAGSEVLSTLGERFDAIVESVESLSGEIQELTAVSEEMASNSSEVAASIEEMASSAEETGASVSDVNRTTQEQRQTVRAMKEETDQLHELVRQVRETMAYFKL